MNLVDLAGSENAAAAGTQGLRQKVKLVRYCRPRYYSHPCSSEFLSGRRQHQSVSSRALEGRVKSGRQTVRCF